MAKALAPKKPRAQLRRATPEKAAWNRRYLEALRARKEAQRADRGHCWCERCVRTCDPQGHHPDGRNGPKILLFFLICRICHDWIHFGNPNAARGEGWLV